MNRSFLLQVIAIASGGGTVQLLIFLLKRKPWKRSVDRESESKLLDSATDYVESLQSEIARLEAKIEKLETKVVHIQDQLDTERLEAAEKLKESYKQNRRLTTRLSQARTDLDIAMSQIEQLTRELRSVQTRKPAPP